MHATFQHALKATLDAASVLNTAPGRAMDAWALVEPYTSCTSFDGITRKRSDITVAMIMATAGDCQRELGNPREAANWYRKALSYDGFYGYAGYYAKVVLDHQLDDHITSAGEAVRRQRRWWSKQSVLYKTLSYAIWWMRYGLWRPDMRREFQRQRDYENRILELVGIKSPRY